MTKFFRRKPQYRDGKFLGRQKDRIPRKLKKKLKKLEIEHLKRLGVPGKGWRRKTGLEIRLNRCRAYKFLI
jgi:hypothetical protein